MVQPVELIVRNKEESLVIRQDRSTRLYEFIIGFFQRISCLFASHNITKNKTTTLVNKIVNQRGDYGSIKDPDYSPEQRRQIHRRRVEKKAQEFLLISTTVPESKNSKSTDIAPRSTIDDPDDFDALQALNDQWSLLRRG